MEVKKQEIDRCKILVQLLCVLLLFLLFLSWEINASPVLLLYCKSLVVSAMFAMLHFWRRKASSSSHSAWRVVTKDFKGTCLCVARVTKHARAVIASFSLEGDLKIFRLCYDTDTVNNVPFTDNDQTNRFILKSCRVFKDLQASEDFCFHGAASVM